MKTYYKKGYGMMNVTICDDNYAFAQLLKTRIKDYFARIDRTCEIQVFSDPQKLLQADLSHTKILFLDVDMPGMNGIEVAKEIRKRSGDMFLVFVTVLLEYAPAGYCVNAFRYLMKSRFEAELPICLADILEKMSECEDRVQFPGKEYLVDFRIGEIVYLEGTPNRMVLVHKVNGCVVECRGKLIDFETTLKGKGFLRIQKSFIVNMRYVQFIKNYRAQMKNGDILRTTEKNYAAICGEYLLWRGRQL